MSSKRPRHDADSDADITEIIKRRRFYTIPKDQQKILDRGNSSYHSLKKRHDGIRGNIPSAVLNNLISQHRRNREAKTTSVEKNSESSSVSQRALDDHPAADSSGATCHHTLAGTKSRISGNRSQHDSTESSNPQNLQSPEPSSSPGRLLSWSPSPTSHRSRPGSLDATEAVQETPAAQHVVRARGSASKPKLRAPVDYNTFPSSDGPEEELEVDIPDAQESPIPVMNAANAQFGRTGSSPLKHALVMQNTPPCAQPPAVIPSTLDNASKLPAQQGDVPKKKRRWMPVPSFSDEILPERPEGMIVRMPNTKVFEIDSSNSTDSSLIVPATLEPLRDGRQNSSHGCGPQPREVDIESSKAGALLSSKSHPGTSCGLIVAADGHTIAHGLEESGLKGLYTVLPRERAHDKEHQACSSATKGDFQSQAPFMLELGPTPTRARSARVSTHGMQLDTPQVSHHGDDTLHEGIDPYQHFRTVYPLYETTHQGCHLHFIRAAAVLDSLRSQRALKSVLYDDFVRAFSEGYVSYVKETGPNRQSQSAFEWYNWKDEPIVFARGVLNQKNLDLVRLAYPQQFSEVTKLITEETPERQMSREASEEVRETIEFGDAEEANESADIELREPDRPRKTKTNGPYLTKKLMVSIDADEIHRHSTSVNDKDLGSEAYTKSAGRLLTELGDTTSHCEVSGQVTERSNKRTPSRPVTSRQGSEKPVPPKSGPFAPRSTREASEDDEPAVVAHSSKAAASTPSAGPNPHARLGRRVTSAPMGPPRSTTNARATSNAPPSSSMGSVRRISSSAVHDKPRPSGMSYLQRLKMKGGNDEAREARMRELGRAKRLSRGGSVTSSHASSK